VSSERGSRIWCGRVGAVAGRVGERPLDAVQWYALRPIPCSVGDASVKSVDKRRLIGPGFSDSRRNAAIAVRPPTIINPGLKAS